MRSLNLLLAGAVLCGLAFGQNCTSNSLLTTLAGGNGQAGNMFDVVAVNDVTVCSFDVHANAGAWTYEVYIITGGGSITGNEANAAAWTLVGTATINGVGLGTAVPLDLQLNIDIPAGSTQGFYVTATDTFAGIYTNGVTQGAVFVQDSNIQVLEGTGNAYPFAATFTPRNFNGNVVYCTGLGQSCPPPPAPTWQTNDGGTTLNFDGTLATAQTPAQGTTDVVRGFTINFSTDAIGLPSDIVYNNAAIVPLGGGGLNLPGTTQIANLNLGGGLNFLFNGAPTPGAVLGATSYNASWTANPQTPGIISAQAYGVNPTAAGGVELSQACEMDVSAPFCAPGSTPLGLGDDATTIFPLGFSFPFYGAVYSDVNVNSNGNITLGAGDVDFSQTFQEFIDNAPRIAPLWRDFNPSAGGTVAAITDNTAMAEICFDAIPQFGATDSNSFKVFIDTTPLAESISFQYAGVAAVDGIVGLSPGNSLSLMPDLLDLSAGAGAPTILTANEAHYEEFAGAGFDLDGTTITFLVDTAGIPFVQQ